MARGVAALDKHLAGKPLIRSQAIAAKCADCMGRYVDGPQDCRIPACPLYPFSPYGSASLRRAPRRSKTRPQEPILGANALPPAPVAPEPRSSPETPESHFRDEAQP